MDSRNAERVDIVKCLQSGFVETVFGRKKLAFLIADDHDLGSDEARISFEPDRRVIKVKKTVFDQALFGDGRGRNTLAHELGHAVMHTGAEKARSSFGYAKLKSVRPFESAEHHAITFAPYFLINDSFAADIDSPEELSVRAGISYASAKIYIDQQRSRKKQKHSVERVRKIAISFKEEVEPKSYTHKFLDELCPACGAQQLTPMGTRYMCLSCNSPHDLQDGDRLGPQ